MKFLKYLVTVFALLVVVDAQAQSPELTFFLKKFEAYLNISKVKPSRATPVPMPNPVDVSRVHEVDAVTGLWYYPAQGKVYDPITRFYLDFDPNAKYRVNTKAGKVYLGDKEVEVKRRNEEKSR